MTKKALRLLMFLCTNTIPWTVYSLLHIISYGLVQGTAITLLGWSFYILCLPGSHGRCIFGVPLSWLGYQHVQTEPLVWTSALLGNACAIAVAPDLYFHSILTRLLYHTLTTPYPCWLVLMVAAFGTFYQSFAADNGQSTQVRRFHQIIRQLILLASVLLCIYLLTEPLIIILNAVM